VHPAAGAAAQAHPLTGSRAAGLSRIRARHGHLDDRTHRVRDEVPDMIHPWWPLAALAVLHLGDAAAFVFVV
jgi:hypothetical protein